MSVKPRVFLDASCWVAAAGSVSGGSALILKLARAGRIEIVATRRILREAELNIRDKLGKKALLRYYEELGALEITLEDEPTLDEESEWRSLTDEKDRQVLSAAFKARVDVLVSLDRRHILTPRVKEGFPIPVRDTKTFLESLTEGI